MDTTEKKKTEKKNSFAKLRTQNYDKALKYLKRKKKKISGRTAYQFQHNFNDAWKCHKSSNIKVRKVQTVA